LGGAVAKKVFTCLNTRFAANNVGCNRNVVIFYRPKSGYFCWSNYAIFQGKPHFESALYHQFRKGLKRAPNSGPRFSQGTQISYINLLYLKGTKACCTQAFDTVLAILSEINEEQCLKRIADLVGSRTVLLRLASDNSCPTIRLK